MSTVPTSIPAPFHIGDASVDPLTVLDPMVGVTDRASRRIVKRIGGVGLATMEFISSRMLMQGDQRITRLITYDEQERPLSIQVYGSDFHSILGFPTLMDGGRITAPKLAFCRSEEGFGIENEGVPPDIPAEQWPSEVNQSRDLQIGKAIEVILQKLEENPRPEPPRFAGLFGAGEVETGMPARMRSWCPARIRSWSVVKQKR